jgi:predicted PurR-regulated permease PerM
MSEQELWTELRAWEELSSEALDLVENDCSGNRPYVPPASTIACYQLANTLERLKKVKRDRTFLWFVILGLAVIILILLTGCVSEPMREGYAQIAACLTAGDTQSAQLIAKTALEKYGAPRLLITPQTVNRTISHIASDWILPFISSSLLTTLLGGGSALTIFLALAQQWLSQRSKRKELEDAVAANPAGIDGILTRVKPKMARRIIAKRQIVKGGSI